LIIIWRISVALNESAAYWLAGSDAGQKSKFRWCYSDANETFKPFFPFATGEPDNGAAFYANGGGASGSGLGGLILMNSDSMSGEDVLALKFVGGKLNLEDSGPTYQEFICEEFGEQVFAFSFERNSHS